MEGHELRYFLAAGNHIHSLWLQFVIFHSHKDIYSTLYARIQARVFGRNI